MPRSLWPQVERVALGEWELRTDPAPVDRLRKRANSCLAIGEPGRPFDAAAEAIRAFYAERDRPALVQVLVGSAEEEAFAAAGWRLVIPGEAELPAGEPGDDPDADSRGASTPRTHSRTVRGCASWSVTHAGDAALDGRGSACTAWSPTRRTDGRGWPAACSAALARVGRRAGRDHAVAARRDRQRAGHRALRGSRAADPPRLPLLHGPVSHGVAHTTVSEGP